MLSLSFLQRGEILSLLIMQEYTVLKAVYSVILRGVDFSHFFGFEYFQEQKTEL